jgi:tetratricopeptide (TPR) repeat protein
MHLFMISRAKTGSFAIISTCVIMAALLAMPVLRAQAQDQTQLRLQALALEQKGQNSEAEEVWAALAKTDAGDAEALAHLGLLSARQEHYVDAIDFYRRAIAINSGLPGLQMNLGLALFKVGQFPDAVKYFTSEIKKHPGDLRLTILLGMAHFEMKDYLVAIPYLQRATELDPQSLALYTTLAQSCLWSKQYQCVVKVQQQLVALKEESAEVDSLAREARDHMHEGAAIEQQK